MNGYNVTVYEPKDNSEHVMLRMLDRPIAFHRIFVDVTGSVTAAVMLSQAFYWSRRTKIPGNWFYKSAVEWQEETGLSRKEQQTARRKLREFDWWQEENRKANGAPTIHYKLNVSGLLSHLSTLQLERGAMDMSETPNGNAPSAQSLDMPQSGQSITETTIEHSIESSEDFAWAELHKHYTVFPTHNSQRQTDLWLANHADLVDVYGRDAYSTALAQAEKDAYLDGRNAEHLERIIKRGVQEQATAQQNGWNFG